MMEWRRNVAGHALGLHCCSTATHRPPPAFSPLHVMHIDECVISQKCTEEKDECTVFIGLANYQSSYDKI